MSLSQILHNLGVDATLLAELASFLVLLWLLSRYVFGPLGKIMGERADRVAKTLSEAEEHRAEALRLQEEATRELTRARDEARGVLEQAERAAGAEARQIVQEAREQAERQLEKAREDIRHERDRAVTELRQEVADLAILVAGKVMGTSLDERVQRDLVERFVEETAGKAARG